MRWYLAKIAFIEVEPDQFFAIFSFDITYTNYIGRSCHYQSSKSINLKNFFYTVLESKTTKLFQVLHFDLIDLFYALDKLLALTYLAED